MHFSQCVAFYIPSEIWYRLKIFFQVSHQQLLWMFVLVNILEWMNCHLKYYFVNDCSTWLMMIFTFVQVVICLSSLKKIYSNNLFSIAMHIAECLDFTCFIVKSIGFPDYKIILSAEIIIAMTFSVLVSLISFSSLH